jgi:putative transposon-encoded protein
VGHLGLFVFWFGPIQAQQFFGHLYKEGSHLGFREFSCLELNYRVVFHRVSSLWGNGAAVFIKYIAVKVLVFIKNYQAQV